MPWQSHAADLVGELRPDGLPAFREAIVTIMRQQGKTTWLFAHSLERSLLRPSSQKVAYTAQTGADARKKLLEDQVPLLQGSPLWSRVAHVHRAQGNESVKFKNHSRIDVLASGASAGHGRIIDLGEVDEAFDDVDDRREQAIIPAMMTREDAQLLVTSTQGTDASVYLNRKIELGRAAALEGRTSGIAYIEYAIPLDEDVFDPRVWARYMPAYGRTTTETAVAHAQTTMTEGEFRRAFGNQRTSSSERVIPEPTWRAVCRDDVEPLGALSFAVDVTPDRDWTSIASGGGDVVEVVDRRPGVSWAAPRLAELLGRHGGTVVLDARAAAGVLIPDLRAAGVPVVELSTGEVTQACGGFYDSVADAKVWVRVGPHQDALDAAVAAATRHYVADAWRWGRRETTDITPLMAVTLAHAAKAPVFAGGFSDLDDWLDDEE